MVITYDEIQSFNLSTMIIQRLGIDSSGRPLTIDGITGNLTKTATFISPHTTSAIGVKSAINELLLGAEELPIRVNGKWIRGNSGRFVSRYYLRDESSLRDHGAWCAAFVGWCLKQEMENAPYSFSALRLLERCNSKSLVPSLGSIATWERPSAGRLNGHVGIVLHIDRDDAIWCIEGNTGRRGAVRIYKYAAPYARGTDRLLGFGKP